MTWWAWTLLWVVLVAFALFVFFVLGRSLWRKAMALITELGAAAERLSAVTEELETLAGNGEPAEPAVFADPAELRRERYLSRRTAGRRPTRPGRPGRTPGAESTT